MINPGDLVIIVSNPMTGKYALELVQKLINSRKILRVIKIHRVNKSLAMIEDVPWFLNINCLEVIYEAD